MPNEITVSPGGWMSDQEARAAAEQAAQEAQSRNEGRSIGAIPGAGPFQGPTGASNLTGWDTRSPSYSPVLDGAAFLMGLAGDILTGSSRAPNALQTTTAAPGTPVNPMGGGTSSMDAFANAIGVTPGTVQGAMASVPSAEDIGLPNGQWGSMIPGSAPILDAAGFNPVQAPGTIAQHSPGLFAPTVSSASFSPVAAAVNQAVAAPAAAPAAPGGLLSANSGGGFPTSGDFSLAASDARMAGVSGFHDPLTGGYVDMGGSNGGYLSNGGGWVDGSTIGPGSGLDLGGAGGLAGLLGGDGGGNDGSIGEGTSGLW